MRKSSNNSAASPARIFTGSRSVLWGTAGREEEDSFISEDDSPTGSLK